MDFEFTDDQLELRASARAHLGYRDADGTFYFAGRTADWLPVGGENFAAGPVGDQVTAAVELRPGAAFDPEAFGAFLDEQPDLGTKWAPRFVRVVAAIPLTATGKVDRKPLRAQAWLTDDPVWWRPTAGAAYRSLTVDDVADLRRAFVDAGRTAALPQED